MTDIKFAVVDNKMFDRMRLSVIVVGITFNELIVKLRHTDTGWRAGL